MIQTIKDLVSAKADTTVALAKEIWGYAELSYEETKSAAALIAALKQEGFTIEEGIADIPTAFTATYQCGSGKPVVGFLAEYDALSGLSQKAGCPVQEPVQEGGAGHGCGHNLLGAGALAAALGVKHYLQATGKPGTVVLYGCPGEEGGAAKAFMARENVWRGLDAALTWHPDECNEVATGSTNACIQVQYTFHGVAAHAAGCPERGRSALDAVELMNTGVQYLREHMDSRARIHYAITDAGGRSPNVVQAKASVLYMVRSDKVKKALELQARVDKIAEGATLMTETTCERKFIDGLAETIPNHALEAVLYRNFEQTGVPAYTQAEAEFAEKIAATYDAAGHLPGTGSEDSAYAAQVQTLLHGGAMNDVLLPLYQGEAFCPGSTDVGDVSWECPTAQLHVAAWPNGCPGHSWQTVSCAKSDTGRKAALYAGKVLCGAAIDLMESPELLQAAQAEFHRRTAAGYSCPIPPDAVPTIAD